MTTKLMHHVQDFASLNRMEKYQHLIELGQGLSEFPNDKKTADNKVPGCISEVYITATKQDNKIVFQGASDAVLVKGMVYILIDILSNRTAEEIQQFDTKELAQLGVEETLTPSRMNATYSIVELMKKKAAGL